MGYRVEMGYQDKRYSYYDFTGCTSNFEWNDRIVPLSFFCPNIILASCLINFFVDVSFFLFIKWLTYKLADINYKQQHRMMSMEIVATRDIQEGEEVSQYVGNNRKRYKPNTDVIKLRGGWCLLTLWTLKNYCFYFWPTDLYWLWWKMGRSVVGTRS